MTPVLPHSDHHPSFAASFVETTSRVNHCGTSNPASRRCCPAVELASRVRHSPRFNPRNAHVGNGCRRMLGNWRVIMPVLAGTNLLEIDAGVVVGAWPQAVPPSVMPLIWPASSPQFLSPLMLPSWPKLKSVVQCWVATGDPVCLCMVASFAPEGAAENKQKEPTENQISTPLRICQPPAPAKTCGKLKQDPKALFFSENLLLFNALIQPEFALENLRSLVEVNRFLHTRIHIAHDYRAFLDFFLANYEREWNLACVC